MPSAWGHTRLLETDWRLITQESYCFSCGSVKEIVYDFEHNKKDSCLMQESFLCSWNIRVLHQKKCEMLSRNLKQKS